MLMLLYNAYTKLCCRYLFFYFAHIPISFFAQMYVAVHTMPLPLLMMMVNCNFPIHSVLSSLYLVQLFVQPFMFFAQLTVLFSFLYAGISYRRVVSLFLRFSFFESRGAELFVLFKMFALCYYRFHLLVSGSPFINCFK